MSVLLFHNCTNGYSSFVWVYALLFYPWSKRPCIHCHSSVLFKVLIGIFQFNTQMPWFSLIKCRFSPIIPSLTNCHHSVRTITHTWRFTSGFSRMADSSWSHMAHTLCCFVIFSPAVSRMVNTACIGSCKSAAISQIAVVLEIKGTDAFDFVRTFSTLNIYGWTRFGRKCICMTRFIPTMIVLIQFTEWWFISILQPIAVLNLQGAQANSWIIISITISLILCIAMLRLSTFWPWKWWPFQVEMSHLHAWLGPGNACMWLVILEILYYNTLFFGSSRRIGSKLGNTHSHSPG